jgi:hypothetical protein
MKGFRAGRDRFTLLSDLRGRVVTLYLRCFAWWVDGRDQRGRIKPTSPANKIGFTIRDIYGSLEPFLRLTKPKLFYVLFLSHG